MMMSPESYHEENLRGRSQEEKFLMTAEAEDDNKEEEGPKLTLLNMRWRYEDAAAFGPIEGDTFAELIVMDENGRLHPRHIGLFTSFALCILMQNMYGFSQKKPNMSARCRPIVEEKVL